MNPRRVFITGIGLACPHGTDPESAFAQIWEGRSAIRKVRTGTADHGADTLLATAECDPSSIVPKQQLIFMDRVAQLGVVAADGALRRSGLLQGEDGPSTAGVYVGCSLGGSHTLQDAYRVYYERKSRKPKPATVPLTMANAPAAHISMRYRLRGPTITYSIACASSAVAIGEAFRAIRDGYLDCVLAGGAESMINDGSICAWEMLNVLAKEHPSGAAASSRPFAVDRSGFVLGEGAAMLTLESEASMRARGASPLVELVGYGAASDATNLTQPAMDGQARAMRAALADAAIAPERIGYINAHATATPTGDTVEIAAIKEVFGAHARRLAVSSTKSMHGHLVGAAGALELAITAMAVDRGRIPPTAHLTDQDPQCDLDCVPCQGREAPDLEYALSNSFAFGGSNAALIVKRV